MSINLRNTLGRVVNIILAIMMFFIGLRVIFQLVSANPATPFVAWIYKISDGIIAPFQGIFGNLTIAGLGSLDMTAIIAALAYTILAYVILAIIDSLTRPNRVYLNRDDTPTYID